MSRLRRPFAGPPRPRVLLGPGRVILEEPQEGSDQLVDVRDHCLHVSVHVLALGLQQEVTRSQAGRRPPRSLDDLTAALGSHGIDVVPDEGGAIVPSLAVGLYAPGGTVEGVGIGSD